MKGYSDGKLNAWPDLTSSYKARICVDDCEETTKAGNNTKMVTYYASTECMYFT